MIFRPVAATHRATFSKSSPLVPLPSTANALTASLPSHLSARLRIVKRKVVQLLTKFVGPVLDQTGGTGDDALIYRRLSWVGGLLEHSPEERYTLKCLPETHLVRHNASVLVLDQHASGAFI